MGDGGGRMHGRMAGMMGVLGDELPVNGRMPKRLEGQPHAGLMRNYLVRS